MPAAHFTLAAMSGGIIGAARQRRPWRARNASRELTWGSAALTSGQTRSGDVATNAGADHQGLEIQSACCGLGCHPGPGADARISADTRSGWRAA